jgi:hypothetical protein
LLSARRASGKTVTEDEQAVKNLRSMLVASQLDSFLSAMEALGFNAAETRELFEQTQNFMLGYTSFFWREDPEAVTNPHSGFASGVLPKANWTLPRLADTIKQPAQS